MLALGMDMSETIKKAIPLEETAADAPSARVGQGPTSPAFLNQFPAGLKNLGATCYLNSQLQALFANRDFRKGVYSWRPSSGGVCGVANVLQGVTEAVKVLDHSTVVMGWAMACCVDSTG